MKVKCVCVMAGKYEEWMVSEWNRVKRWRECEW